MSATRTWLKRDFPIMSAFSPLLSGDSSVALLELGELRVLVRLFSLVCTDQIGMLVKPSLRGSLSRRSR